MACSFALTWMLIAGLARPTAGLNVGRCADVMVLHERESDVGESDVGESDVGERGEEEEEEEEEEEDTRRTR